MDMGNLERGQQRLSRWSGPGTHGLQRDMKGAGLVQSAEEEMRGPI